VMKLSDDLRASLLSTAKTYHNQLLEHPDAVQYLEGRGLSPETVRRFVLGFVGEPAEPVDESFTGRISIPYLHSSPIKGWSCSSFKFRLMPDVEERQRAAGGKVRKYMYRKGLSTKIFNPAALLKDTDYICVTEGELDAISAEQAGLPTIGIPGATQWEDWYPRLLGGYQAVYMLQDEDKAGEDMSAMWADPKNGIANVKVIVMDKDVNHTLVSRGENGLRDLVLGDRALFFA